MIFRHGCVHLMCCNVFLFQYATLSRKLIDTMNDYNMCQVTYREKCKERIQRQLAISKTTSQSIF